MDELDRIDSWKQIAAYLGRSERTVRRWQQVEGLPVHRHLHQQRGSVWAYKQEVDEWLATRKESPEPLAEEPEPPVARDRRPLIRAAVLAAATILGVILLWPRRTPEAQLPQPEPLTALPGRAYGPAFSPDGRKVAFFWERDWSSDRGIFVKELGTDSVTPLITVSGPPADFIYNPAWSPDGRTIAYLRRTIPAGSRPAMHATNTETWLCLIQSSGGAERRFLRLAIQALFYGNLLHLNWSRDGKRILAPMEDGAFRGVHWIPLDGSPPIRLTSSPPVGYDRAPVLSPDERAFVFLRPHGPPQAEIETLYRQDLHPDGSAAGEPKKLYETRSQTSGAAWLSPQELLVCRADSALFAAFNSRLFRMRSDGSGEGIPVGLGHCCTVTVAHPEGVIAYGSGDNTKSHIWRAALDDLKRSEPFAPSSRFDAMPSYSPDGSLVAFVSNRSGRPEVWIADRSGGAARKLSGTEYVASVPRWSPEGTRLTFGVAKPSKIHSILTIAVNAGAPSETPLQDATAPSWAAGGQELYFWRNQQLWRARLDGSSARLLGEYPVHWIHSGAAWGRDERELLYVQASKPFALFRANLDSGKKEMIEDELASPFIATSRRFVYFTKSAGQEGLELRAIPLAGGHSRKIGQMSLGPDGFARDRGWLLGISVTPDDKEIVWSAAEEQQLDLMLVRNFR